MSSKHCDICFEDKSSDDFGFLPCTHSFCTVCIRSFRQKVCALCRHPFTTYQQNGYVSSLPIPTTIHARFAVSTLAERERTTRDDMYISETVVANRRLQNRLQRRMRRRRRRLRTNRRPRRSENMEDIFQMDDILPAEPEVAVDTEVVETEEATVRKPDKPPRRDNWQYQQQQRSRYSR
jgi:hypothetical protein